MKKFIFIIILSLVSFYTYATHNRAGEITYRQISGLTFEVTIVTYTATGPGYTADRPQLEILWGDNTKSILPRSEEVMLPDYYKRNKYVGQHTYPGPGLYSIVVEDPNRNFGVVNIPNSVNTVFSISTTMYILPEIGINNTPVLTRRPLDKAAVGRTFIHNPGAYDPDGDSISYKLTSCRAENGEPIAGYTPPAASRTLYVNEITGDLVWDAPIATGIYNVAMLIEEWRRGVKIGEIIRDMQIEVFQSDNEPPVIEPIDLICIEAGKTLEYTISATDPNNDKITLTIAGGPFASEESIATFEQTVNNEGHAEGLLTWFTKCHEIRKQPYTLNIKAEDNSQPVSLVHMRNLSVMVVGPPVKDVTIESTAINIDLNWRENGCTNVTGYNIYRRIFPSGFVPDHCEIGVPDELGFERIAYVDGRQNTSYTETDVAQGHEYCYLICAVFNEEVEGYASEEVCISLLRGIPTITNVSVLETNESSGEIYVAWSRPSQIDIGDAPGPYQYVLYRSEGFNGENFIEIHTYNNLDDTIFTDNNLNTKNKSYSYKVEFYNNTPGNRFLIGTPHIASSIFLHFEQMENALKLVFTKNVPWINTEYTVFRRNDNTMSFDSIANFSAENEFYIDKGLINGKEYCYYLKSIGSYSIEGIINPIINLSQINCEEAIDTTPPCPPILNAKSNCEGLFNTLDWVFVDTCYNDVEYYNLYYTPFFNSEYKIILKADAHTKEYVHYPATDGIGLAGCYYVTAVDSFSNESNKSNIICLDNCYSYKLPNVFSPNGDGINDFFQPLHPYYGVVEIDIKILNRWGQLLFETNDPEINWDGRDSKSGKPVSDGVYFYNCDVHEQRLTGIEVRHLQGFIHVYNATNFDKTPKE